uniref:Putative ASCH domain-containing protein n=1 Tax=viral metagenome TaxID=1070528 RepID=A0A6M3LBP2_9ZZZZ
MKALSIRQPWAWLIVHGYKDVENRTWPLPEDMRGQRIYVHAGVKVDWDTSTAWILDALQKQGSGIEPFWKVWRSGHFPTGALVGEVTIIGQAAHGGEHLGQKPSPWYEGPCGFLLDDAVAYDNPIPWRGQLRFFEVLPC